MNDSVQVYEGDGVKHEGDGWWVLDNADGMWLNATGWAHERLWPPFETQEEAAECMQRRGRNMSEPQYECTYGWCAKP